MVRKNLAPCLALCGILSSTAFVFAESAALPPVTRKHEAIEIKDTAEYGKILLETLGKTLPRTQRAAVFVSEVADGYRLARAAGRAGSFGARALAKTAPATPFLIGWFGADAALSVSRERNNMQAAGDAADRAINRLEYLLKMHTNGEVKFGGRTFKSEEIIPILRQLREDLTKEQGTEWGVLKEVGKSALPWTHNNTAEEANASAVALYSLEQAVTDATFAAAIAVEEQLKQRYRAEGERALAAFYESLSCNLYVTCLTGDKAKKESFGNWKKVSVPIRPFILQDSPDTKRYELETIAHLLARANPRYRSNGCLKESEVGKTMFPSEVRATIGMPATLEARDAGLIYHQVRTACQMVKGWTGEVYLNGSTYQSHAFETFPISDAHPGQDLTAFFLAIMKSNPQVADSLARHEADRAYLPRIQNHQEMPMMIAGPNR